MNSDTSIEKVTLAIAKARRLVAWCNESHKQLLEHAQKHDFDGVERNFVTILLLLESVFEALEFIYKRRRDLDLLRVLEETRQNDELINYVWQARVVAAHMPIVIYEPSIAHIKFEIVDKPLALSVVAKLGHPNNLDFPMLLALYSSRNIDELSVKLRDGYVPSTEHASSLGVKLHEDMRSLALRDFVVKSKHYRAPDRHLGKPVIPSAITVARSAIDYYQAKVDELQ